ncbi:MAG TPA: ABC transporter substrate-binding protein [Candidatus Binatia bacterium]|jgi:phospholipid transport system substrate-binding protein
MKSAVCILSAVLGVVIFAAGAHAGAATDQTRQTVDKVFAIISDPALKPAAKQQERREKLRQVIYPRFDFAEMAKRSLGPHWNRISPQQQQDFVRVFTGLLENAYAEQIEASEGEKVRYTREQIDGDSAEVFTKVITPKGEEVAINYKLHKVGSDWKAYDVIVENISLVNNYRSQFNRVLANASFDELMRKMQQKSPDVKGSVSKG